MEQVGGDIRVCEKQIASCEAEQKKAGETAQQSADAARKFFAAHPLLEPLARTRMQALAPADKPAAAAHAVLCAFVSILFCKTMHGIKALYARFFPNPFIRAFAGGVIIILLSLLLRTDDYLGPGMNIIERALHGETAAFAFLLKILFTALTIGAGFKGGEIVPSFFTGATFGCLFAILTGANAPLCAAIGMVSVFCGVTNCPITALLISFELFGFDHAYYYLIAIAVSYMLSGYYSLYHAQTIVYSKFENSYVNRHGE